MSIPPISSSSGFPPPFPDPLLIELGNRLSSFSRLAEAWDNDPTQGNLQALESCMTGLESFLDNNKTALFQAAAAQGWGTKGPAGSNFASFYQGALNGINGFLEHPNEASLTLVNEQVTQMHWLLTHFWHTP
jgi:hypothetical protein